jgi:hypothetical protein
MPRSRPRKISIRCPKDGFRSGRHKETPAKNAWEFLPAGPARAIWKPLPTPEGARSKESSAAMPKSGERSPKLLSRIQAPPEPGLWRVVDSPSRSTPFHSMNPVEARGEIPFRPPRIFRRADKTGRVMCANQPGVVRHLGLFDIPSARLPSGCAEAKDRRESGAPRRTRDTTALREMPNEQTDPDTHARVGTRLQPCRNQRQRSDGTPRPRFGSLPRSGTRMPAPDEHRDLKGRVSEPAGGKAWLFPGSRVSSNPFRQ